MKVASLKDYQENPAKVTDIDISDFSAKDLLDLVEALSSFDELPSFKLTGKPKDIEGNTETTKKLLDLVKWDLSEKDQKDLQKSLGVELHNVINSNFKDDSLPSSGWVLQVNLGLNLANNDEYNMTSAHHAVIVGNSKALALMIEQRSGILERKENSGFTPAHLAAMMGKVETLQMILKDLSEEQVKEQLDYLIERGNAAAKIFEREAELIKLNETNVNEQDENGMNPLMRAVKKDDYEMVAKLFELGAYPNIVDNEGKTALTYASIRWTNEDGVEVDKLERGAILPYLNRQLYDFLLQNGADPKNGDFVVRLKYLGLRWGLDGKLPIITKKERELVEMEYPSGFTEWVIPELQQSFNEFIRETQGILTTENITTINKALDLSRDMSSIDEEGKELLLPDILERIKSNEMVLLDSGWMEHSIQIIIHKDKLIICNRGSGSDAGPGISIYKIGRPENITEDLIRKIITPLHGENGESFIRKELHEQLELQFEQNICAKGQKVGNCPWASLKTALHAMIYLRLVEENVESAKEKAKEIFDIWVEYDRERSLSDFIEDYESQISTKTVNGFLKDILLTQHHLTEFELENGREILVKLAEKDTRQSLHLSILNRRFFYNITKQAYPDREKELDAFLEKLGVDSETLEFLKDDKKWSDDLTLDPIINLLKGIKSHAPLVELKTLLEYNPDLMSYKDEYDNMLLHYAVGYGHSELVEYLINQYGNILIDDIILNKNSRMQDLVSLAIQENDQKSLKLMLQKCSKNEPVWLFRAISSGNIELVNLVMEHEKFTQKMLVMPLYRNQYAMHAAANSQNPQLIQFLIDQGCDINAQDLGGRTPLHLAIEQGNIMMVEVLLEKGALLTLPMQYNMNPLAWAKYHGNEAIIDLLESRMNKEELDTRYNDFFGKLHNDSLGKSKEEYRLLLNTGKDISVPKLELIKEIEAFIVKYEKMFYYKEANNDNMFLSEVEYCKKHIDEFLEANQSTNKKYKTFGKDELTSYLEDEVKTLENIIQNRVKKEPGMHS